MIRYTVLSHKQDKVIYIHTSIPTDTHTHTHTHTHLTHTPHTYTYIHIYGEKEREYAKLQKTNLRICLPRIARK